MGWSRAAIIVSKVPVKVMAEMVTFKISCSCWQGGAAWWSGLPTVSTFRVRWGWRCTGHPLSDLSGDTFVSIKKVQQGIWYLLQSLYMSVCVKYLKRTNQEMKLGCRVCEREVRQERDGQKGKKDCERAYLLACRQQFLFQSRCCAHRAGG